MEDNVRLGPVLEGHLPKLMVWRNGLRPVFRQFEMLNMVNQRDWFERVSRDHRNYMYAIMLDCRLDSPHLIGVCGLTHVNWKDRSAEVSMYIGSPKYRGQGYGATALDLLIREGFRTFGLHRLTAEIYAFNEESRGLFESLGFCREGVLREAVWALGKWHDAWLYSLLESESPPSA